MHLFLSPHPDDAALSCGGTIYHLREAESQTCVILTVMSGDPPQPLPDTPLVRDLHQRWEAGENPMAVRRKEDEDAALVLSAKTIIHTALPDCVYRTHDGSALYPDEASIFGAVHPADTARDALFATPLPFGDQVTHLYAPLGVGHHVDHQIVRDWAVLLKRSHPGLELRFYEDYPYAEKPQEVARALRAFPVTLVEDMKYLREMDLLIKLTALQSYRSQISTFWPSIDAMDRQIAAFMQRTAVKKDALAERFWRMP